MLKKVFFYLVTTLYVVGCSGKSQEVIDARKIAAESVDKAQLAFQQKDFTTALENYSEAIESGGLQLDVRVRATIHKAVCQGALGDLQAANKTLDELERKGASGTETFYAARSYLYAKQGDKSKAAAAWRRATRMNRRAVRFVD